MTSDLEGKKLSKESITDLEEKKLSKKDIIERNISLLKGKIVSSSLCSIHFNSPEFISESPFAIDSGYLEDGITYIPLWITYDSKIGEITPPRLSDHNEAYSMIFLRYAYDVSKIGDSWVRSNYIIDLNDPDMERKLSLSKISQELDKNLASITSGSEKLNHKASIYESFDPEDSKNEVLNIYAQRLFSLNPDDVEEIKEFCHGNCSPKNYPAVPDKFGNMQGDKVILESILKFNVTANIKKK